MLSKIQDLIDKEIRPALQSHGGDIEISKFENNKLYVTLQGGCRGCPGARATLKNGVERIIQEKFPQVDEIVDVTGHI